VHLGASALPPLHPQPHICLTGTFPHPLPWHRSAPMTALLGFHPVSSVSQIFHLRDHLALWDPDMVQLERSENCLMGLLKQGPWSRTQIGAAAYSCLRPQSSHPWPWGNGARSSCQHQFSESTFLSDRFSECLVHQNMNVFQSCSLCL
jgi:hypothetical protein